MSSPSQLLSLWDMLKVYAKEYVEIGGELSELEMVFQGKGAKHNGCEVVVTKSQGALVHSPLQR